MLQIHRHRPNCVANRQNNGFHLKRAENISRSPLFSHIASSLEGVAVIRAYGQSRQFTQTLKQLLDRTSACMFMFQSAMRWLAIWLDLLVVLITFTTALMMVFFTKEGNPAYAGAALAFAIQMSGIFQFTVRMHSEMEAKMTCVERIQHYIHSVEQEPEWIDKDYMPPVDWPQMGRISFRDVRLRYREDLPNALKGVSFDISGKETVGIVGRTGSGKSSLGVALFRLADTHTGSIQIDGVDIKSMGLHDLRRRIAMIPQDPVMFSGTVRFNLDPLRQHKDETIWEALEKTHVKELISNMNLGLDSEFTEGGGNVSVGERQLLSMARALLKNVKILLLDEATSNVDANTDELIRQTLNEVFSDCTVLIIAHRLSSVLHSDKILYMDGGKLVEFDQPHNLLNDSRTKFFQMVKNASSSGFQPDAPYFDAKEKE